MLVTPFTKKALSYRRVIKGWKSEGFEEVGEGGGMLWQIRRGCRVGQVIREVRIAPDGMSVFVRISSPTDNMIVAA